MQSIIKITNGVVRMPAWRMAEPVNFTAFDGDQIAIVGPNGGGKTMLVNIITGSHPLLMRDPEYDFSPSKQKRVSDNIKYITFRDAYGGDNERTYYLQQRWNQTEIDDNTPTVREKLDAAYAATGENSPERQALREQLYDMFNMRPLLDKHIILLSSGELRKLRITETLFSRPRVLIMDNPFIGLDAETRDQLRQLFASIIEKETILLILVLSKADDIPDFITHVVEVTGMKVGKRLTCEEYLASRSPMPPHIVANGTREAILSLPYNNKEYHAHEVARLNHVSIRYGERTILKNLDCPKRRALGIERAKRLGQIDVAQSYMRRQPTKLCLRHFAFRDAARERREHLGHKKAHRLRFARNTSCLSERLTGHTDSGKRSERFCGVVCKAQ